jgi:hypothetical protein
MPQVLQPQERIKLQGILARRSEFSQGSTRERNVLMSMAGLMNLLVGIDLSGPPGTTAGAVILKLEGHGELSTQPGYHALGALLSYLLALGDLPRADAKSVATLIVKYALVKDADYVSGLRTEYGLAEVQVVAPKDAEEASSSLPANMYELKYLIALRKLLIDRLNEQNLRDLCFDLGVNYEDLGGSGRAGKVRELVDYVRRRRIFPKLLDVGKGLRDDIVWEEVFNV